MNGGWGKNEDLRKEDMPQPIDAKLSEVSHSNLEDADLDITLIDEMAPVSSQPQQQQHQVQVEKEEEKEGGGEVSVAEKLDESGGGDKLKQLLLKVRAQKQSMAERRALENSSVSSLDSTMSSRASSPREQIKETMTTVAGAAAAAKTEEAEVDEEETSDDALTLTDTSHASDAQLERRAIRAVMMSSHNVSSLNEELVYLDEQRVRATRRKVAKRTAAPPSIDLSHASRDPVIAAPKDILNKNVRVALKKFFSRKKLNINIKKEFFCLQTS